MVATDLRQDWIEAGAELVTLLDQGGMQPDAALWVYQPELKSWKLVLAEAKISKDGPREVYRQIQKYLTKLPEHHRNTLSLEDIALAKPDSLLIRLLKGVIKTGSGVSGIRFQNNVINGTLIEDAYIYRLT
jgi:uncharacterized membrane protein